MLRMGETLSREPSMKGCGGTLTITADTKMTNARLLEGFKRPLGEGSIFGLEILCRGFNSGVEGINKL